MIEDCPKVEAGDYVYPLGCGLWQRQVRAGIEPPAKLERVVRVVAGYIHLEDGTSEHWIAADHECNEWCRALHEPRERAPFLGWLREATL